MSLLAKLYYFPPFRVVYLKSLWFRTLLCVILENVLIESQEVGLFRQGSLANLSNLEFSPTLTLPFLQIFQDDISEYQANMIIAWSRN